MIELSRPIKLKLTRVEEQMQILSASISEWVIKNPISADAVLRDGRFGFRLIQRDFATPAPLDSWGLIIGECVHNLRSALDNLAFALARLRSDPPLHPGKVAFPIFEVRTEFENKGRRNIDQLPNEAALLIERMQPFQRDGSSTLGTPNHDALILLQWLSNMDKHRVPQLAVIAPVEISHNVGAVFQSDDDAAANVPPDTTFWAGPLEPGVVLFEWRTNRPIVSVTGEVNGNAIVAIQTPHGFVAVIPTLQALHYYTALIISQFNYFFQ